MPALNEEYDLITIQQLMEMEFPEYVEDDGKYFTIKNDHGGYDIEKSRCTTPETILKWVHHLSGKIWVQTDMLHEFVDKACRSANLKIY